MKKIIIHYMTIINNIILILIALNPQLVIILIMKVLFINYVIHLVKHVKSQAMKQITIVKNVNMDIILKYILIYIKIVITIVHFIIIMMVVYHIVQKVMNV